MLSRSEMGCNLHKDRESDDIPVFRFDSYFNCIVGLKVICFCFDILSGGVR
jgi:hypothetical protein